MDELFAAAELLANGTRVGGDRLCILTNGGGPGTLAADGIRGEWSWQRGNRS